VCLEIRYKGQILDCTYKADFICYENIIVELKAVKQLTNVDRAQTLNYLKATQYTRGLLFNFGSASLEFERLVNQLPSA
jgi:GxxExxY protein